MNRKTLIYIIASLCFAFSCAEKRCDTEVESRYWLEYKEKLDSKDFQYLIDNSLDSVICTDCVMDENDDSRMPKNRVFGDSFEHFYNPQFLKDKCYSVFEDDSSLIVSYLQESSLFGVENGSIHYRFKKAGKIWILDGMFTTP